MDKSLFAAQRATLLRQRAVLEEKTPKTTEEKKEQSAKRKLIREQLKLITGKEIALEKRNQKQAAEDALTPEQRRDKVEAELDHRIAVAARQKAERRERDLIRDTKRTKKKQADRAHEKGKAERKTKRLAKLSRDKAMKDVIDKEEVKQQDPITWQTINGFTESVLAIRYDSPKPVPNHHLEMWKLCTSPYAQVAIAAPRGSAKSTAITFAYVITSVLFEEHAHVLIISANEELAAGFLNEIRTEFHENPILAAHPVIGIKKFIKERETEIIVEKKNGFRFRIIVKGAEQRMRGLKWERKRPSLVVADDLEDEELVSSELRREKFRRWFYGAVKPIVKDGGKIRVVGTIMHMDSLLMRFMPPEKDPETVITPLKTYSKAKRAWKSVLYRAHDPDFSELLWKEMYPKERLQEIRQDFAEQGMLDVYGQEYLNDPIDQASAYFHKEDFIPMSEEDKTTHKTFYSAGDLAITENKRSAFTALGTGGMDADGILHLVNVRRGRWDSLVISDEIFSISRRYEPDTFRLESENIQKSIGPFLYKRMDDEQHYINLDAKPPTKDKLARAQSIRARMRAGKVRFDKQADWYADFEEEMLHFPKWPYKDQVDMFAWMGLMLDDMVEAPTAEQFDEDEWERDNADDFIEDGICEMTGY